MSYRDSVPYTHCDDNIVEHARWVVAQMGPSRNDFVDKLQKLHSLQDTYNNQVRVSG